MNKFDKKLIYAIQKLRHPVLDKFFRVFTHIAEYGAMWTCIAIICFLFQRTRDLSYQLAMALIMCSIFGEWLMKLTIRRKRPFTYDDNVKIVIRKPRDFSHPSGHTSSCFAAATVFLFVDWRIALACYVFAAAIAFSRVYLFVHYPTDVIAGALWGVAFGVIAVGLYWWLYERIGTNALFGWEGFGAAQNITEKLPHYCENIAKHLKF